jgi:hypothetical protein
MKNIWTEPLTPQLVKGALAGPKARAAEFLRSHRRLWVILALVAGLSLLVFFLALRSRYEFINAGGGDVYRADRWTGAMVYISDGEARPVSLDEPEPPDPEPHPWVNWPSSGATRPPEKQTAPELTPMVPFPSDTSDVFTPLVRPPWLEKPANGAPAAPKPPE